ncbi:MAG: SoxR reducing system RseC family protein [Candidatus Margulisiibacteriota bacterium]
MKVAGKVVKLLSANLAQVQIVHMEACGNCSACGMGKVEENLVEASNQIGAVEGAQVELEVPSKIVFKGAMLVFVLPLVLFFLGYLVGLFIGKRLVNSEAAGIVGAVVFFVGGLFLVKCFDSPAKKPEIIGIINPA